MRVQQFVGSCNSASAEFVRSEVLLGMPRRRQRAGYVSEDFTRKLTQAVSSTAGSTHINALQTTPAYSYNTLQELHCII